MRLAIVVATGLAVLIGLHSQAAAAAGEAAAGEAASRRVSPATAAGSKDQEKTSVKSHAYSITDQELFAALDLSRPGLEAVGEAVEKGDYPAACAAWAEYFRKREKPTPHFSRDTWGGFLRKEFPQLVKPILEQADRLVRGEISHSFVTLPVKDRRINWLHNPKKDYNYIGLVGSRWFMNPLGRAYLLTGDEKYAQGFAWLFESWYDHLGEILEFRGGFNFDPVFHAYYPGIRSRILVDNYYCMARSPALSPAVHVKILKHLLASVLWLEKHNRQYRVGNQQVAAVLGLAIVGMVLPEFKDSPQWVSMAEARLAEHLQRDFHKDGGHSELCTQYHNTVLRDTAYVVLTAKRNGRSGLLQSDAAKSLERAYEWLAAIVMPSGQTPTLHSASFATDWAVHLRIGAGLFARRDFAWLARRFWQSGAVPNAKTPFSFANFIINEDLSSSELAALGPRKPDYLSINLESSGFAVMRTGWEPADRYLVFQYGWGSTGHAYPGALHFCLAMNDELIATSPGSPRSYSHPAYRYCYSTPAHNLISINMKSYARSRDGGKLHRCVDLPGAWYVSAQHEAYKKQFGAVHRRSILVIKDGPILFRDILQGGKGQRAQWNFHTPLGLEVLPDHKAVLRGRRTYRLVPAFADEITSVVTDKRWETVLPRDCQPHDCGKLIPVLRYEKPIDERGARFCVALAEGKPEIEALAAAAAFRLHTQTADYLVLYKDAAQQVQAGNVTSDAECTCVRFGKQSALADRAWVISGRSLKIAGSTWLKADSPGSVEIEPPKQPAGKAG